MRFLGITLMFVALLALLLPFMGAGFQFFQWTERWGESRGFGIKAALAFVGFLLWRFAPQPRR